MRPILFLPDTKSCRVSRIREDRGVSFGALTTLGIFAWRECSMTTTEKNSYGKEEQSPKASDILREVLRRKWRRLLKRRLEECMEKNEIRSKRQE